MADPYKDWTPDERVSFLGGLGLRWVSGEGENAVWQAPDGSRMTEQSALTYALGQPAVTDSSGKITQQAQLGGTFDPAKESSAAKADRITQGGVVYEKGPDGQFHPLVDPQGAPTASTANGTGMAQVGLGYAQLENTKAQQAVQNQQWQQQFDQTVAAADRAYQQKQAELQQAGMINMYNIAFNDKKQAFAEASDNKHLALQSQQMAQDLQYKQADIQLRQQTLNAQYATFNAQAANEAARFNAQMAFNVQQANQQFETAKQDRLANIATQAGTLAQNPGDIGKLAATLEANSGWGQANAATSGQDYRTDQSKTPLESLLRTRQDVQNSTSPYSFTPVQASQIGPGTLAGMMGQTDITANPNAPWQTAAGTSYKPTQAPPAGYSSVSQGEFDKMAALAAQSQGQNVVANPNAQAAAGGGVLSSALRKVGERGPELQIDLADGRTMVLNAKQQTALAKAGLDLSEGAMGYASGGLYDNAFSNVPDSNRDLSTGFLNDAYKRAVSGTPWEGQKQLPSPVWLSSPGTNPLTAQLVGSLKSLAEGVPADTTSYLANLYRPLASREMVTGRTR